MTTWLRILSLILVGALSILAAWRIVAHTVADALAERDPQAALRWIPEHPQAQLVLARRQLAEGDRSAAASTAHRLLESEPLQGDAWSLLGDISATIGSRDDARSAYESALSLTPRNSSARLWLIDDDLTRGDYPTALEHIDRLLRSAPALRSGILAFLAKLAADPQFRESLVPVLAASPAWRGNFLRQLPRNADPETVDAVLAGLRKEGVLTVEEHAQWIENLIVRGDWSQAYARWVGTLPDPVILPLIYNGDFAHQPTGKGFDWRIPEIIGASVDVVPGVRARIDYRNRRISMAGPEQALLLGPGSYRLTARMRPHDLRADRGLEWAVICAGSRSVAGRTPPIKGSGGWRNLSTAVQIPQGCNGQWLRFQNAVHIPALQTVSGEIEIEWVTISSENPNIRREPEHEPGR